MQFVQVKFSGAFNLCRGFAQLCRVGKPLYHGLLGCVHLLLIHINFSLLFALPTDE